MTLVDLLSGARLLLVVAVLVRACAAAARAGDVVLPLRLVGGLLAALAAWLAAAAAGFWAPLWMAVVAGVVAGLLDRGHGAGRLVQAMVADGVVVALAALLSVPSPGTAWTVAVILATALAGGIFDLLQERAHPALRVATFLLPVLLWRLAAVASPELDLSLRRVARRVPGLLGPDAAVVPVGDGERLELETGDVAFRFLPPGEGPWPGAVLLHGAHPAGSRQRSAAFIRRALLGAGHVVVALDHRGYGHSPDPEPDDAVEEWDPLPAGVAAVKALLATPGVRGGPLLVGHSMGATDALRLLVAWPRASGVVLMGATVDPETEDEHDRLDDRFVGDMQLDWEPASVLIRRVRRRYHSTTRAAEALPSGHAPILFVEFAGEFENIASTRDRLFEMLPGRKIRWRFPSGHYLGTERAGGLLMGDYQNAARLAEGLALFARGINPSDGSVLGFSVE